MKVVVLLTSMYVGQVAQAQNWAGYVLWVQPVSAYVAIEDSSGIQGAGSLATNHDPHLRLAPPFH